MTGPELVTCICDNCNSVVCCSSNEWTEISSTYSTYVDAARFSHPGLETVEPRRPGSKDSALEGCYVKPLRCMKCKTVMGLKCVDAAPDRRVNQ